MERDSPPEDAELWENKKIKKALFERMDKVNGTNLSERYDPRFDDEEDDPDAGHTVNGKELSPEEYRQWKEEEGEYEPDVDRWRKRY
jgi:hypothetical protein